jgi:glycosyltransferase involved in cell wall biosynthesis
MTGAQSHADPVSSRLLFFGAYDPTYPRNLIIRKGWRAVGHSYAECRVGTKRKVHTRYPALIARYLRMERERATIYVPEFRHKDVPLARAIASIERCKLVFDPLVSRYETRVLDRGDVRAGSLQAWHNRNLDRLSFGMSDLVIADTGQHAAFYRDWFGVDREKIKVLPVGFDDEIFHPVPWRDRGETLEVLFYGSFLPLHGIDTIVAAASELAGEKVRFTLVGEGQTLGTVKERVASGRMENVRFIPQVSTNEIAQLISRCDIVLGVFGRTPKTTMVVPNKIYQALAVGRPVITADTPALREFFVPGAHLEVVPAGDGAVLAAAIVTLGRDRARAKGLADTGSAHVRERFNPVEIARRLRDLLEEN